MAVPETQYPSGRQTIASLDKEEAIIEIIYSISKVEHLTKPDCLSYSNPIFDFTEFLQFTDYRAYNYHLY